MYMSMRSVNPIHPGNWNCRTRCADNPSITASYSTGGGGGLLFPFGTRHAARCAWNFFNPTLAKASAEPCTLPLGHQGSWDDGLLELLLELPPPPLPPSWLLLPLLRWLLSPDTLVSGNFDEEGWSLDWIKIKPTVEVVGTALRW